MKKIYVLTAFNFNDGEKITPSLQAFTVWKMQLRITGSLKRTSP
jgi:hypothetical protein